MIFKVTYGNHSEEAEAHNAQEAAEAVLSKAGIEPVGIPRINGIYVHTFFYENVVAKVERIGIENEGLERQNKYLSSKNFRNGYEKLEY